MEKRFVAVCVATVTLSALAVLIGPDDDKRKAFPLVTGRGSCSLTFETEPPWRVGSSWIEARNSETLWKRHSKTFYTLSNAYAPQEFVIVGGTLVRGYGGKDVPPEFRLTVPAIDLQWEDACGEAADEDKEDDMPAALLVTSDKRRHRHLIVNPAADKTLEIGRRVTLLWSDANLIRVWRRGGSSSETLLSSGATLLLNGPTYLRIEPLAVSNGRIRFTAYGEADDYNEESAEDTVWAFTYDLELSCVKFNHDTAGTAVDGINLRRSRDASFDISNGEWNAAQGAVAPVCYKTNQPVTVKARFRTSSPLLRTAQIRATNVVDGTGGGCFRPFGARTVAFGGGETQDVEFAMDGTTPSAISLFERETLAWVASRINGETKAAAQPVTNSGPHRVYVILGDPVSPWSNAPGNAQNAWTNALEFIVPVVEGLSNARGVLTVTTQHLFSGMGFEYNLATGGPCYSGLDDGLFANPYFMLTDYMQKKSLLVNCVDQSGGIVTIGRLLGVPGITALSAIPFGYINPVNLIGIGMCNNPIYGGPIICHPDDLSREKFISHTFVQHNDLVFDATIGPTLGESQVIFLHDVVDMSTPEELDASLFTPTGQVQSNVFQEVFNLYNLE